jgi:hypothetical protein
MFGIVGFKKPTFSGLATARPMAGMYDKDGKSSKGYKA